MNNLFYSFVKVIFFIMPKTILFTLILFAILSSSCTNEKGASPQETTDFVKTYGGSGDETANEVIEDEEGNVYCFGTTTSYAGKGKDFYLLKTDREGNKIFEKNYGDGADETGYAIAFDSYFTGNLIMTGSKSTGPGLNDILLIEADTDGNLIFSKTYGTAEDDVALCVLANGSFVIGGYTTHNGGGKDFYVILAGADGSELWSKEYGGPADDFIHHLGYYFNSQGKLRLVAFGNTNSYGAGGQDFYLMKLDEDGDSLWSGTYGSSGYEQAGGILVKENAFYMCGHTASFGHPEHNVYLVKTDTSGQLLWEKNYGGHMHDGVEMGILSDDKNIISMTGYSSSYGAGDIDFLFFKTDLDGNFLSIKSLGTTNENVAFSLAESGVSFYLAGYDKNASGSRDLMLVKTKK